MGTCSSLKGISPQLHRGPRQQKRPRSILVVALQYFSLHVYTLYMYMYACKHMYMYYNIVCVHVHCTCMGTNVQFVHVHFAFACIVTRSVLRQFVVMYN